jgi:hypothetical protein
MLLSRDRKGALLSCGKASYLPYKVVHLKDLSDYADQVVSGLFLSILWSY